MEDFYKRENVSDYEINLKVSLPTEAFATSYKEMLAQELKKVDMKGFRKGKVPSDMLEKQIKPAILLETFQKVAPYYVNAALMKEELTPIAPPEYMDMGELDDSKPINFTVKVTIMPTFKLASLKKIKPDTKEEGATEQDIEKTLENMFENNQDKVKGKKADDKWAKEIAKQYQFDGVENIKDLKVQIKSVVEAQKTAYIRQTQEAEVMANLVKASKIEVPKAAIRHESKQREESFQHELSQMNTTVEDFLKSQGMEMKDLRKNWMKDAQQALEHDIVLKTYSQEKNMKVEEKELEEEIDKIKVSNRGKEGDNPDLYKDPQWQAYVGSLILKQKAYRALVDEILGEYTPITLDDLDKQDAKPEKKAKKKKK